MAKEDGAFQQSLDNNCWLDSSLLSRTGWHDID